jgi:hypothetical protein
VHALLALLLGGAGVASAPARASAALSVPPLPVLAVWECCVGLRWVWTGVLPFEDYYFGHGKEGGALSELSALDTMSASSSFQVRQPPPHLQARLHPSLLTPQTAVDSARALLCSGALVRACAVSHFRRVGVNPPCCSRLE